MGPEQRLFECFKEDVSQTSETVYPHTALTLPCGAVQDHSFTR
jgi:hypothetical protein